MPCGKAARGTATGAFLPPFTAAIAAKPPFNDAVDNNPCGKSIVSTANGVSLASHSLCLPHLQGKLGIDAFKPPYVFV